MSWQLLVPIVEKLIDAGVEYYKSDIQTQGSIAATSVAAPSTTGATILLAVEPNSGSAMVSEAIIREALERAAADKGLRITTIDICLEGEDTSHGS